MQVRNDATHISTTFEMTDGVAAGAAREVWLALGRRLFTIPTLALMVTSATIFVLALRGPAHPLWLLLSGTGPALFVLTALGWAAGLWWVQRAMLRKVGRLPHRQVVVEITDSELVVQTALERVQLAWSEVRELRILPGFCLFRLRGGGEIPVPLQSLPDEALAVVRSRVSPRVSQ